MKKINGMIIMIFAFALIFSATPVREYKVDISKTYNIEKEVMIGNFRNISINTFTNIKLNIYEHNNKNLIYKLRGNVLIKGTSEVKEPEYFVVTEMKDGIFIINLKRNFTNISGEFSAHIQDLVLEIYLPKDFDGNLDLTSNLINELKIIELNLNKINLKFNFSKIEILNSEIKELIFDINSCEIKIEKLKVENVEINSTFSKILIDNSEFENMKLDLKNDNINILNHIGNLNIKQEFGKSIILYKYFKNNMKLDIKSVDLIIKLPENAEINFNLNEKIYNEFESFENSEYVIEIKKVFGDVRIEKY